MFKRRFFQLHLSTAVVLMLVAGVLLWANMKESESHDATVLRWASHGESPHSYREVRIGYGWPLDHKFSQLRYSLEGESEASSQTWIVARLIYNALIALVILLAVWQVREWRIRRREAK